MPHNLDPWTSYPAPDLIQPTEGVVSDMALTALDQVCWHLTCCDFIFDVVEEESDVLFHQLAADIEHARFRAERIYSTARKLDRLTSDATKWQRHVADASAPEEHQSSNSPAERDSGVSTAGAFLDQFEGQFDDGGDSPLLHFTDEWPTCQDIRGKNGMSRCRQPTLYLGEGQWSANCRKHARRVDRERHERWDSARDAELTRESQRREELRQEVGRAVIGWWRERGGPLEAIREVLG
ncbi:MAG: hypothetical protein K1X67_26925 [Fimbriimonadaceae bacterium]|nr:hypothetical protein [Fimbriimonadaceae bacterium]